MFKFLRNNNPLRNFLARSFANVAYERPTKNLDKPNSPEYHMALEYDYGCHNSHPIPAVITKAKGVHVWDVDGKHYYDCLAAYAVVNQGHCHPKIIEALTTQANKLHLISRAFYSDQLGHTEKFLAETFGYEKTLMMNAGVEAGESGLKICRRWAYTKKNVPKDKAVVLFAAGNFWGRTLAACASSDDPERYHLFGPFSGMGFEIIPYNDVDALQKKLEENPNIAGFMVEPIQGEAGVIYPDPGYLKKVSDLCKKHNVLLIADEVQTGCGRTGKLFCSQWDNVKPDILLLGKALSGGMYPISAILTSREIMDVIRPGDHGSTYGGNPLACAVARRSIELLFEENMIENSLKLGHVLHDALNDIKKRKGFVKEVRGGKGLFAALELHKDEKINGWEFAMRLKEAGLLVKPTKGVTIRIAPPLVINEKELGECVDIINKVANSF